MKTWHSALSFHISGPRWFEAESSEKLQHSAHRKQITVRLIDAHRASFAPKLKDMASDFEPTNSQPPRKRASDALRHQTADTLAAAFAEGQLSTAEFDERTADAWRATFTDELEPLVADLSPVARHEAVSSQSEHSDALSYLTDQPGGSSLSLAIMGGTEKTGDWHIASTHMSFAVMGGNSLDLRQARLSARDTVIDAFAVMGGIEIIVPEDVRVIDDGIGIMGGFGISNHRSCTLTQKNVPADAPVVRIRGFALMGAVDIIRAARNANVDA